MLEKIKNFIEAVRPYNTVSVILSYTIGFFLNGSHLFNVDYFIGVFIIILIFSFATIQNDIEDLNIDKINNPDKPITSEKLSLKEASKLNIVILGLIFFLSLYNFPRHIFFTVCVLSLTWAYNKPPFYLSRRPFSSLLVLTIIYSSMTLLYGYSLAYSLHLPTYILFFIPCCFLTRLSVLILKDYKDAEGDKLYDKRTFYLTFGPKYTAWVSFVTFCLGSVGVMFLLFIIRDHSWLLILPGIFLIRNLYIRIKLFKTSDTKKLANIFHMIFLGQNQFDILYLLCLICLK